MRVASFDFAESELLGELFAMALERAGVPVERIRGLAVGNVKTGDWARVLSREVLQGLVLGLLLASVGIARALLEGDSPRFALLIGVTIICIVVMGCVAGAMTPLALHRAKVDPATSSTPFISTMVDVLGIVIYLTLAQLLLGAALRAMPAR